LAPVASVAPHTTNYGEEVTGSLVDMYLFSELEVIVLSTDGWGWALTWAQLGVTTLRCYPLTRLAEEQLAKVVSALASTVNIVIITGVNLVGSGREVVSFHCGGDNLLGVLIQKLAALPHGAAVLFSMDPLCVGAFHLETGIQSCGAELRHWRLGGLMMARLHLGWYEAGGVAKLPALGKLVLPGHRQYPTRPIRAFLEPSAKLTEWRVVNDPCAPLGTSCWDATTSDALPFHWPPAT